MGYVKKQIPNWLFGFALGFLIYIILHLVANAVLNWYVPFLSQRYSGYVPLLLEYLYFLLVVLYSGFQFFIFGPEASYVTHFYISGFFGGVGAICLHFAGKRKGIYLFIFLFLSLALFLAWVGSLMG